MPVDAKRLRKWFAVAAIAVAAISAGFFLYSRLRARSAVGKLPEKLGVEVQQSTAGFTLSKSEAGRTIFTVHASKAVQYKEGGHAELHDVSIVVYGRRADRFDQIYGADFEYDPQSGDIIAQGEVGIDLEGNAQGPVRPDQATPIELKNPIHLKTSGLVFNQKTGYAATKEKIEFRIPQASGSAVGATYDSKANVLTLQSGVRVQTVQGATMVARHGVVTQNPRRAVLNAVRLERPSGNMQADQLTLFLRDDNSIARMLAAGDVRGDTRAPNAASVRAAQADFEMGPKDAVRSAVLSGGVSFEAHGLSPFHGNAGRATLEFGAGNVISKVRASDGVTFIQDQKAARDRTAETMELTAQATDLWLAKGHLDHGQTEGAAQIVIRPQPGSAPSQTVVTAGRFDMTFDAQNRMKSLHGEPDAKIVSATAGQPDKVSTSRVLDVAFSATSGGIASITQQDEVRYSDGQRTATATRARYTPSDGNLLLTGSPRWVEGGLSTTAESMRFNRQTGDAAAQGEVKTTYNEPRTQPGQGALLGGNDPIHVTAASMAAHRATSVARYTGGARLWQGANIVEAPVIEFDRQQRQVVAEGRPGQRVSTVFVEQGKDGKVTPATVTASRLTYSDTQRRAVFRGGVQVKSTDAMVTSDQADVLLLPRSEKSGAAGPYGASQVEEIVAQGHVVVRQPSRQATGNKLVYTAAEGKFVLTGGPPSIFDAEHGSTTGDSLTFYQRGDTVLVGSETSSRTVTRTRVAK